MSSYRQRRNKLSSVKGIIAFIIIFTTIGLTVYLMFLSQIKKQESKIITEPIILNNSGEVIQYELDEEDVDEDTGLKAVYEKLKGMAQGGEK